MMKSVTEKDEDLCKESECFFCSATGWVFDGKIAALCRACLGDGTMKMPKTETRSLKNKSGPNKPQDAWFRVERRSS